MKLVVFLFTNSNDLNVGFKKSAAEIFNDNITVKNDDPIRLNTNVSPLIPLWCEQAPCLPIE